MVRSMRDASRRMDLMGRSMRRSFVSQIIEWWTTRWWFAMRVSPCVKCLLKFARQLIHHEMRLVYQESVCHNNQTSILFSSSLLRIRRSVIWRPPHLICFCMQSVYHVSFFDPISSPDISLSQVLCQILFRDTSRCTSGQTALFEGVSWAQVFGSAEAVHTVLWSGQHQGPRIRLFGRRVLYQIHSKDLRWFKVEDMWLLGSSCCTPATGHVSETFRSDREQWCRQNSRTDCSGQIHDFPVCFDAGWNTDVYKASRSQFPNGTSLSRGWWHSIHPWPAAGSIR